MKTTVIFKIISVGICVLTFLSPSLLLAENTVSLSDKEKDFLEKHPVIVLGSEKKWEPYIIVSGDGIIIGYDADILSRINTLTGANFKLVAGDWRMMQDRARKREIDGLSTGGIHDERKTYLNFSDIYISLKKMLIVERNNPSGINSLEDLTGKKIAVHRGNLVDEKLAQNFPQSIIVPMESIDEMIKAVITGDVDATFGNGATLYYANKIGMPYLKMILPFSESLNLAFGVRKDWPEAVSILNKGLQQISLHERTRLIQKWFTESFEKDLQFKASLSTDEYRYLLRKKKISYCIDPSWRPIEFLNKQNQHDGISKDYIRLLAEKTGISFEMVPTINWIHSIDYAQKRKCDLLICSQQTQDRKKFLDFSIPYLNIPLVVSTLKDAHYIDKFSRVANFKYAMVKNYGSISLVKEKYPEIDIVEVGSIVDGLDLVRQKKVSGFIDTAMTISDAIRKQNFMDMKISGTIPVSWDLSIGSRNDEPVLNNIINKAVGLISDEDKHRIYSKWVSVKYEYGVDYFKIFTLGAGGLLIIGIVLLWNRRLAGLNRTIRSYQQMIDSNLFLLTLDAKGQVVDCSSSLLKETGYALDEVKGLEHDIFFNKISAEVVSDKGHNQGRAEIIFCNESNENKHIEIVPIKNGVNNVYLLKDITEKVNALENEKKRELLAEKENILNNIHDGVGGIITMISMISDNEREKSLSASDTGEINTEGFDKISALAHEGMKDLRLTMSTLSKGAVCWNELPAEFRRISNIYLGSQDIKIRFEISGEAPITTMTAYLHFHLVMWFKEAITNIIKHSQANQVEIFIEFAGNLMLVHIRDNGVGVKGCAMGMGIRSMQNRAKQIKAIFSTEFNELHGCHLTLEVKV